MTDLAQCLNSTFWKIPSLPIILLSGPRFLAATNADDYVAASVLRLHLPPVPRRYPFSLYYLLALEFFAMMILSASIQVHGTDDRFLVYCACVYVSACLPVLALEDRCI